MDYSNGGCPNCGYCSHCGRGGINQPIVPYCGEVGAATGGPGTLTPLGNNLSRSHAGPINETLARDFGCDGNANCER